MKTTKKLITAFSKSKTMNSYEFWKVLNKVREERGASHIRHNDFLRRVEDELNNLPRYESFVPSRQSEPIRVYQLTERQMLKVGMRESKKVRDNVIDWLDYLIAQVTELKQHKIDRCSAALNYKSQSDMVKQVRDSEGKETRFYHFSNEADLLNSFALGMSAAKYRKINGLDKTDNLRDTLTTVQLELIAKLEVYNTSFIAGGIDFETRKQMLNKIFMRDFNQRLIDEHMLLES